MKKKAHEHINALKENIIILTEEMEEKKVTLVVTNEQMEEYRYKVTLDILNENYYLLLSKYYIMRLLNSNGCAD